jgi:hypothetical protein
MFTPFIICQCAVERRITACRSVIMGVILPKALK